MYVISVTFTLHILALFLKVKSQSKKQYDQFVISKMASALYHENINGDDPVSDIMIALYIDTPKGERLVRVNFTLLQVKSLEKKFATQCSNAIVFLSMFTWFFTNLQY